jgi:hypothetical protein
VKQKRNGGTLDRDIFTIEPIKLRVRYINLLNQESKRQVVFEGAKNLELKTKCEKVQIQSHFPNPIFFFRLQKAEKPK